MALRRYLPVACVLVLAIGLRFAYLPVNTSVVDQSALHAELAHNILDHGRWFAENTEAGALTSRLAEREHHIVDPADVNYAAVDAHPHWQPYMHEVVGPGLVLSAIWAVTGSERFVYGKVFQIAVDLAMLLVVYRIAMLLFARRRTALIAVMLYAVCPPIARQSTLVDPDIWALDFTLVIIALYLEGLDSPNRTRWLLACGLAVGVGAYFRPNVLLLPFALGLASLRGPGVRRPLRDALAIAAVAALLLVPWTIRNYVEAHRFIPIRVGSGTVLWLGLGEVHNDFGALVDDVATYEQVHRVRPDLEFESPAYDEYLRQRAMRAIERHPLFYAKVVARRILHSTVAQYESAWMYRTGESPVRYRARTGRGLLSYVVNRPFELLETMLEPAIFALAMLALAFTWRRYRRAHLLLIAAMVSALLPYWILHFETRYGLPTLPMYLMWISLGADLLGEHTMRRLRARQGLREAVA